MAEVTETKLIPQATKQMEPKKRQAAPGTTRVTIALQDDDYKALVEFAKNEMREPNNMLSYLMKGRIKGMLDEEKAE